MFTNINSHTSGGLLKYCYQDEVVAACFSLDNATTTELIQLNFALSWLIHQGVTLAYFRLNFSPLQMLDFCMTSLTQSRSKEIRYFYPWKRV